VLNCVNVRHLNISFYILCSIIRNAFQPSCQPVLRKVVAFPLEHDSVWNIRKLFPEGLAKGRKVKASLQCFDSQGWQISPKYHVIDRHRLETINPCSQRISNMFDRKQKPILESIFFSTFKSSPRNQSKVSVCWVQNDMKA